MGIKDELGARAIPETQERLRGEGEYLECGCAFQREIPFRITHACVSHARLAWLNRPVVPVQDAPVETVCNYKHGGFPCADRFCHVRYIDTEDGPFDTRSEAIEAACRGKVQPPVQDALTTAAERFIEAAEQYRLHTHLAMHDDIMIEARMISTRESLRAALRRAIGSK